MAQNEALKMAEHGCCPGFFSANTYSFLLWMDLVCFLLDNLTICILLFILNDTFHAVNL